MEHAEQVRLLKILMNQLDEKKNVDAGQVLRNPAHVYTSRDLAEKEWRAFFREHPQNIGMSGDLPNPGTFLTREDWGVPVLATRDRDGVFRAFLNSCRHRGAQVESEARGERARFSCPFHAWTYDDQGALVGLPKPDHFGDVDRGCLGLTPLPAVERDGVLWVHPQVDGTIDADALMIGIGEDFRSWGFGDYVYVGGDTYEAPINWKLALDTFGETYHFNVLHRETLAQGFYGNVLAYDTFARNHRMILCLKSIDALRGEPESSWQLRDGAFPVYFMFPNVVLNIGAHSITAVRVYPVPGDPGRSVSRLSFYYERKALQAGDYRLVGSFESTDEDRAITGPFEAFASVVRDEDYAAAAQTQKTAQAGHQEFFLFGRNEPPLHHYHNTFRDALGMPPLEPA